MKAPNMVNKDFPSSSHRAIHYFLATYPSFLPIQSNEATRYEQESAYKYIHSIYQKLYDDPSMLGFKHAPDDHLAFGQMKKGKPDLVKNVQGVIKKTEEFIELLCKIASSENVSIKAAQVKQLEKFGIQVSEGKGGHSFTFPKGTEKGLALLAKISTEESARAYQKELYGKYIPEMIKSRWFSRGIFDTSTLWAQEIFGNMLADRKAFDRLIGFLVENNYERIQGRKDENTATLDFVKNYGSPKEIVKSAWGERTHGGIELTYKQLLYNPFVLTLRIPYLKGLLMRSESMEQAVRDLVKKKGRKCDRCRYCIQTDKTGKKPFAFVAVDEANICPLFPGFHFSWNGIDDGIVGEIIAFLEFIDEVYRPGGVGVEELMKWTK